MVRSPVAQPQLTVNHEEDVTRVAFLQEEDEEGVGASREVPVGQRVQDPDGEPEAGRGRLPGLEVDPALAQLRQDLHALESLAGER